MFIFTELMVFWQTKTLFFSSFDKVSAVFMLQYVLKLA